MAPANDLPLFPGMGAGQNALQIQLSTWPENFASIHLIESHPVPTSGSFVCWNRGKPCPETIRPKRPATLCWRKPRPSSRIHPSGIRPGFFPVDGNLASLRKPEAVLAAEKHLLGVRRNHRLAAPACGRLSPRPIEPDVGGISLEGTSDEAIFLLSHLIRLEAHVQSWETMVPCSGEQPLTTIDAFQQVGFQCWHEEPPMCSSTKRI